MSASPDRNDDILERAIRHLEASCSEERDYIALLNQASGPEFLPRIMDKIEIERQVGEIMTMGTFQGKRVTIFCNGKLVLKGFESEDEVKTFLVDLLR